MENKRRDRVSAADQLHVEAHERLTKAQRGITEKPSDPAARAEYAQALQEMRDTPSIRERSPEVRAAFDRAHSGEKKKVKKAAVVKRPLELKPPAPKGMGGQATLSPQVSPYLREPTQETPAEKKKAAMRERLRMKREFRKASRDAFER